jgi:hypothetical protein
VLDHAELPAGVREGLAAVCARRSLWREHIRQGKDGPAPVPETGSYATDLGAVKKAVATVIEQAGKHAGRHHAGKRKEEETASGQNKEAAWLLARVTELIVGGLPAVEPKPTPVEPVRRGRRK